MSKRGFIEAFPIIVTPLSNGKYQVCDGQHRLTAAKSLGIPVCYYVSDFEIDPATVPASKAWSKADYIKRYASLGYDAYVKVIEASKKTSVSISTATSVLTDDLSTNRNEAIRDGSMVLVDPVLGYKVLDAASRLCYMNKNLLINPLARVLGRLSKLESISFSELSDRVTHNVHLLSKFTDEKNGIREIEEAYNYKLPHASRVPIEHEIGKIMSKRQVAFNQPKTN